MALQKSYRSRYSLTLIAAAYFKVVETNLNFADSEGRITLHIYESQADRDAGLAPLDALDYAITPHPQPAMDANGAPLTRQADGTYKDAAGNTVTPTTPPFPSFDQLVNGVVVTAQAPAGTKVFDIVKAVIYNLLKTRPEFAGSTDV